MVEHDHELDAACLATRDEFSALLDDELSPVARMHVESHLAECSDCLRALDGMKKVTDLYAALPPVMAPADFEDRVRAAVRPKGIMVSLKARLVLGAALAAAAGLTFVALPALQGKRAQTEATYLAKASAPAATPASPPPPAPVAMRAMAAPEEKSKQRMENNAASADAAAQAGPSAPPAVKNAPEAVAAPAAPEIASTPAPAPKSAPAAGGAAASAADAAPAPAFAARAPAVAPAAAKPAPAAKKAAPEQPMRPNGPVKDEGRHWNTAQRSFVFKAGVWQQLKYAGESVRNLPAKGGVFKVLVDKHPELKLLEQANAPVIFRVEDTWYKYMPMKN